MSIKLKKLSIVNFKGIKSFEINFNHITNVFGDNATGKTTIFDAFLWLFFGKNCEGISQFEVKRLDEKNKFIEKQGAPSQWQIRSFCLPLFARSHLQLADWVRRCKSCGPHARNNIQTVVHLCGSMGCLPK